jgi:hypothetical protein
MNCEMPARGCFGGCWTASRDRIARPSEAGAAWRRRFRCKPPEIGQRVAGLNPASTCRLAYVRRERARAPETGSSFSRPATGAWDDRTPQRFAATVIKGLHGAGTHAGELFVARACAPAGFADRAQLIRLVERCIKNSALEKARERKRHTSLRPTKSGRFLAVVKHRQEHPAVFARIDLIPTKNSPKIMLHRVLGHAEAH